MLGIFSAFIFFSNFSIDFTFLHNFEFHLFLPHMNTISTIKTICFFGYFKPTAIYHVIILFLYFLFFYLFAIFACFTYHFAVFLPSSEDNESFQHWQEYPNENPLLTFLTRSSWTSPGGSGRTLLFRHPITSPHTSVQPATQATKSPASSPQQLIQHTPDIQHPGCAHTGAEVHEESWQHPSPRGGGINRSKLLPQVHESIVFSEKFWLYFWSLGSNVLVPDKSTSWRNQCEQNCSICTDVHITKFFSFIVELSLKAFSF